MRLGMVKYTCLECNDFTAEEIQFHKHIRTHNMSQKDYYTKHFPRFDKLDNTPIEYKNREQYFSTDFQSKSNLKGWLLKVSRDTAREYVRGLLVSRRARKNLIYTPCQVELRSLLIPGMVYMNNLFGSYYQECAKLGYINRFSRVGKFVDTKVFREEHFIIADTREQTPLGFNLPVLAKALPFGDYALNDAEFSHNCHIERKSMGDLYGTFSTGLPRFYRELDRANKACAPLIVLVESSFNSVYQYPDLPKVRRHVHIHPEHIMHNIRETAQKYPNTQFLFVENREEAGQAVEKLLSCGGQFNDFDLQYMYDTGQLF